MPRALEHLLSARSQEQDAAAQERTVGGADQRHSPESRMPGLQANKETAMAAIEDVSEPYAAILSRNAELRGRVEAHLSKLGIRVTPSGIVESAPRSKDEIRAMHSHAVMDARVKARASLGPDEPAFVARLAAGNRIDPNAIRPRLVAVRAKTFETRLWRWASLHWSVPTSTGYGRRLRYLVVDEAHHDSLIGLIGVGDPVYALESRDRFIGWSSREKAERLHQTMEAFVLGAVPPYSDLLGGKLVALLATSDRVHDDYETQYDGRRALISGEVRSGPLVAITTASALGRSSIYNRLTDPTGRLRYLPAGYTTGSGDFHFHGPIYDELLSLVVQHVPREDSSRHRDWGGNAYRNRREVITRAFDLIGLDGRKMRRHGVRRELYVAPLARNWRRLLKGEAGQPQWAVHGVLEIGEYWRNRWAIPRSVRTSAWTSFRPESWQIWPTGGSRWLQGR